MTSVSSSQLTTSASSRGRADGSLSEYLIAEVRRGAERPSISELRQRLAERTPVTPSRSPAEAVRAERDAPSR